MKVAIFESEHYESAYSIIRFFDIGDHSIFIYTIPASYDQLRYLFADEMGRYTWIVKEKDQSIPAFIKLMQQSLITESIDLLFLNTVSNNFIHFARMLKKLNHLRTVLTIHGINSYFKFAPSLSVRRVGRYIGKRLLLQQVNEFNVISEKLIPALQKWVSSKKKIHTIGFLHERIQSSAKINPIELVIPGSVDNRRRDYNQLFQLLDILKDTSIEINIILLGPLYKIAGQEIADRLNQFDHATIKLHHYGKGLVPAQEYERVMRQASIVWLPSVIHTIVEDGVPETYGQAICSGNFFDIVKYATPFISPLSLNIDSSLNEVCFRYKNVQQIADLLSQLQSQEYLQWKQRMADAVANYKIQNIRKANASLLTIS